jgi:small-conductance mechanosensitive channel/CRP-like cAMP-binding protein
LIDLLGFRAFAALGVALVLIAALVNRFAPAKRARIRRALFLYALFGLSTIASEVLAHVSAPRITGWSETNAVIACMVGAFTCVELAGMTIFDLLLPAVGVKLVTITSDIVIGFAYVFATFAVFKQANVPASSVVTTSAVVSGVLALSLQTTLGNILGGVALQLDGSVHVGDWVQLPDATQGRVVAIRWRHTVIETRNWDTIIVPNATLLSQNIIILGKRTDKPVQHRMWVYFNVDFRYPPSRVIDVVKSALSMAPIEGVALDPPPSVICYDFAKDNRDSFAYYAVRYWLTDLANDDPTNSRIRTRIYTALERANLPLAKPAQTVFFAPAEQEADRGRRHRERRMVALTSVEIFRALNDHEREALLDHLEFVPYTTGETITKQGAVAHWLYMVCAGKVEVRRRADGSALTKVVATIEAPGFFGEMGMLTGEPRRADVVAITDVDCFRLDKTGLESILKERPEIAAEISSVLAKRALELESISEGLDEEAKKARMAHLETHMLDRIQQFFGLERTTLI